MAFNLVRRGGTVLRNLRVNGAFARPVRVGVRHVSFVTRRSLPSPPTLSIPRSSAILGNLIRSYATAGRPKGSTSTKSTTKKTTKKTRKTAKKAAPKKKKRVLTETQLEKKKAAEFRQHIRELKKAALQPPKQLPATAWAIAISAKMPEAQQVTQGPKDAFRKATELAQAISAEERERYVERAKANKAANEAAYDAWIQTHTPLQIKEANAARRRLARLTNTSTSLLNDDRLVKRPNSAFIQFFKERRGSGEYKDLPTTDMSTRVADEWRSLSDAEKEKYIQLSKADRERYHREYRETYGEEPPRQSASPSA